MSRKTDRVCPRHAFGTDCRSAVRPRHAGDSWFDRARSRLGAIEPAISDLLAVAPTSVITSQERYAKPPIKYSVSGICRASARRAKRRWSDSSLQVEDPKASGTPTSLANTCATFPGSATTMAAHSIMVCALCQRRSLASAQACSSDLPSSCAYSERYRNDGRPL